MAFRWNAAFSFVGGERNNMTKYRTKWQQIEAVDVEKESDCFVWINGRRNAKTSSYECYFRTFDDAKAYLLDKAECKVAVAQSTLDRARNELAAVRSLQPNRD
jgi:hypothetical protein